MKKEDLKIGMKLTVREDLVVNEYYGCTPFLRNMEILKGKEVEVVYIGSLGELFIKGFSLIMSFEMMKESQNNNSEEVNCYECKECQCDFEYEFTNGDVATLRSGEEFVYINGMLVRVNNESTVTYIKTTDYNDNLEHESNSQFDIMFITYGEEITYKREKVDWTKIKEGTKVLVRDENGSDWIETIFCMYLPNSIMGRFLCFDKENSRENANTLLNWKQCKLA